MCPGIFAIFFFVVGIPGQCCIQSCLSAGWYPIGFALSIFVYFLAVVVCIVFFVLSHWLFVSLSLWVLIRNKKMSVVDSLSRHFLAYSSAGLMQTASITRSLPSGSTQIMVLHAILNITAWLILLRRIQSRPNYKRPFMESWWNNLARSQLSALSTHY